jgi:hypothetical protein
VRFSPSDLRRWNFFLLTIDSLCLKPLILEKASHLERVWRREEAAAVTAAEQHHERSQEDDVEVQRQILRPIGRVVLQWWRKGCGLAAHGPFLSLFPALLP